MSIDSSRQKCWGWKKTSLLSSRHMVALPTSNASFWLEAPGKALTYFGEQNYSVFKLSPILTEQQLLSSNLFQFTKFKKKKPKNTFAVSVTTLCKVWLSLLFHCSHFIFTLLDLSDRVFCYLFAIRSFFPFFVGSRSIPNSFFLVVIHSMRSGYSSYKLFPLAWHAEL